MNQKSNEFIFAETYGSMRFGGAEWKCDVNEYNLKLIYLVLFIIITPEEKETMNSPSG